jgi:hypothetical protein
MNQETLNLRETNVPFIHFGVTQRSNRLINYFLGGYFLLGLFLAAVRATWLVAFGIGGCSLAAYYAVTGIRKAIQRHVSFQPAAHVGGEPRYVKVHRY